MSTRAASLASPAVPTATDVLAVRRAALWVMLAAKLVAGWGVRWDIEWHVRIGRDSFWIAPHVMTYSSVALVVLVCFGMLAWETWRRQPGTLRLLGIQGTRGFQIAAWGIAITVLAAPIDDLWHRLFGLDVTLWSPPHLLGFLGAAVNSLGCLVIAREVYAGGSPAGLLALVVAGAWVFGSLHPILEPAGLVAFRHGGVGFHTYAILAALLLPLALVPTARLSGRRWAPIAVLAVVVLSGMAGDQVVRAGFAWFRPVPAAEAEIARDPTSDIALAREIRRQNAVAPSGARGGAPGLIGLIPPLMMAAVDARRRPVGATLVYALAVFVLTGSRLADTPAFRPMVPTASETAIALGLTLGAAVVGGLGARWMADRLVSGPRGSAG